MRKRGLPVPLIANDWLTVEGRFSELRLSLQASQTKLLALGFVLYTPTI
jgi:hypothetical protein